MHLCSLCIYMIQIGLGAAVGIQIFPFSFILFYDVILNIFKLNSSDELPRRNVYIRLPILVWPIRPKQVSAGEGIELTVSELKMGYTSILKNSIGYYSACTATQNSACSNAHRVWTLNVGRKWTPHFSFIWMIASRERDDVSLKFTKRNI